jgi:hypothetical protein
MRGLQLTYETLGQTRNEAAVDVLLTALDDADPTHRGLALKSLLRRKEERAPQQLLESWEKVAADDLPTLRTDKEWIWAPVEAALQESGDSVLTAIDAAEALELTTAIPQLALIAESSESPELKERCNEAIMNLVRPLGAAARDDRDQPTVRGPVQHRLADSVRRFSMHRNERLVDAFLLVSNWGDNELRQMVQEEDNPHLELLCGRFAETEETGILELLAGYIRRKNMPKGICPYLKSHGGARFRKVLLEQVTGEPNATVLRNLHVVGMPKCCRGGERLLDEVPPEHYAPLIHLAVAANDDAMETLQLIVAAVAREGPGVETAAATALSRCKGPDADFWMRAAVPLGDGQEATIEGDDNAHLLKNLIELLGHSNPGLSKSIRQILEPLHAEQMLSRFQPLRRRSRRRLGKVVMMIDPDAIERVNDTLQHSVLSFRLDAIAAADAFNIVDKLSDSFSRIVRDDQQEARILAVEAMGNASGPATLRLLQDIANLPVCPVRDAAMTALERRKRKAYTSSSLD